ncbi:MAG: DUF2345 domain-containing protein, partial [Lysobacteraceae bacterium]
KKVVLAVSGGASITIEGGSFTAQCPGKITVKAATKSMVGGATQSWAMPDGVQSGAFQRQFVIRRGTDEQPISNQKYRVTMDDGRVIEGVTDVMGQTQMADSEGIQNVAIELLYD